MNTASHAPTTDLQSLVHLSVRFSRIEMCMLNNVFHSSSCNTCNIHAFTHSFSDSFIVPYAITESLCAALSNVCRIGSYSLMLVTSLHQNGTEHLSTSTTQQTMIFKTKTRHTTAP